MSMRRRIVTVVTALSVLGVTEHAVAQGVVVGKIADLTGAPQGVVVRRGTGPALPGNLMMALNDGDVIVITDKTAQAQVQLGNRPAQWLCAKGSASPCELFDSLRVQRSGRAPVLASVWAKCGASLSRLIRGDETGRDILAVRRRGDAMVIPVLGEGTANVAAGTRPLTLSWTGGDAPYQLRVYRRGDGDELLNQHGIAETTATTAPIVLAPGDYAVELVDATNHRERVMVHVVPVRQVPSPGGAAPAPSYAATTVGALWLANQGEGAWVWEASLRLIAPAKSGYASAQVLQAALLKGLVPPIE